MLEGGMHAPYPSNWPIALNHFKGAAYGKCIVADYNNVSKDKCVTEFLKLKQCFMEAYKKP
ncbi:hypothetical protein BU26DRAFT_564861 [Trematosphaeria pertusa]|uniref:IMS import disulfide relay-system CHCH-CHCH-like Cx9C domain-containing protein n=1 Tax=Trematosphaeria pertusa TaxID=390896 RepID=A0A6A6II04_9PLEO|nr:uncharacterized protein BU26DRAFT_564861 [Trematosphaeria pertusa]KAF2249200.1 hypothetical protein BU26DRAFT_564861 [Trematosphaeria pertusa]